MLFLYLGLVVHVFEHLVSSERMVSEVIESSLWVYPRNHQHRSIHSIPYLFLRLVQGNIYYDYVTFFCFSMCIRAAYFLQLRALSGVKVGGPSSLS